MKLINDYSELIENEIAGISFPNEPKNLYDPLSYFLALGGKRMRPLLTILSGELFGEKKENLMPAAIAIELFHNFSLIFSIEKFFMTRSISRLILENF